MAGQHSRRRNRKARTARARRGRVVGLGASAGAFLAFGLTPLAGAPAAHADEFDVILDPIISSLASIDPTLGADLSTLVGDFTTSGNSAVVDFSTVLGASTSVASLVPDTSSAVPDSGAAAASADSWSAFTQGLEQDWITSSYGSQVDSMLNTWAEKVDPSLVGNSCGLICNGADGTSGGP